MAANSGKGLKNKLVGYTTIFVTVLILAVFISFYLWYYVSRNETKINARNFRALHRIAYNLNQRIPDLSQLASFWYTDTKKKTGGFSRLLVQDTLTKYLKPNFDLFRVNSTLLDSTQKKQARSNPPELGMYESTSLRDSIYTTQFGGETYLVFRKKISDPGEGTIELGVKISSLVPKLLKYDFFTGYALIKDNQLVYNDFSQRFRPEAADSLIDHIPAVDIQAIRTIRVTEINYSLFTYPFTLLNGSKYYLTGIVPSRQLLTEKLNVPESFVFALLFLILGIAVIFPFLKILLMNANEKMKAFDILLSVFSLTFGSALFFYILFSQYQYLAIDSPRNHAAQCKLADDISKNFVEELRLARLQLTEFDSLMPGHPESDKEILNVQFRVDTVKTNGGKPVMRIAKEYFPNFKLAFWLNAEGGDTVRWTKDCNIPVAANYSDRLYFKNALSGALWNSTVPGLPPFLIQPVRSWKDGEFRTVIAQRSVHAAGSDPKHVFKVAVISSSLPSVTSNILPYAFSFCVINTAGEVWYHSDSNRNLNENLLDECDGNVSLKASLESRTETTFNAVYSGFHTEMHIKPVAGMPLYVVVMRDESIQSARNVKIFTISVFFIISLMMMLGVQIGILLLFNIRSSKMRANKLRLDGLWPDKQHVKIYQKITGLNLMLFCATLLVIWIFDLWHHASAAFFLCLFNALVSISVYYASGHIHILKQITDAPRLRYFFVYITTAPVLACALLLGTSGAGILLIVLGYIAFTYVLVWNFFKTEFRGLAGMQYQANPSLETDNKALTNRFSHMLLSWVLLAALLPVSVFIRYATDFETLIAIRQEQVSLVDGWNQITNIREHPPKVPCSGKGSGSIIPQPVYEPVGIYQTTFSSNTPDWDASMDKPDPANEQWLPMSYLPSFSNGKSMRLEKMMGMFGRHDHGSYCWSRPQRDTVELVARDLLASVQGSGDRMNLKSFIPWYRPAGFNRESVKTSAGLFWFIALLFFYVLFNLIRFFIKKMFLPDYLNTRSGNQKELLEKMATGIPVSLEGEHGIRLVVVSMPHSGKTRFLQNENHFSNYKKWFIDCASINDPDLWKRELEKVNAIDPADLVILLHFEFNLSEEGANLQKFTLLEKIFRKKIRNTILVSAVHPGTMLNHIGKIDDESKGVTTDIIELIKNPEYYRWSALLSSFEVFYYPLNKAKPPGNLGADNRQKLLADECAHGLFLNRIYTHYFWRMDDTETLTIDEAEDYYLRIQNISYTYYLSMWNSLTLEEQYVLYDLAEDGLVNYKNFEALSRLYFKGLVVNTGRLQVMNQSFRNFILMEVKKGNPINDDAVRSRDSDWKKFRVPFYIIFLVVMFFVFYTQQETFNTLTTILGSFAASLPLLLKMWSVLSEGRLEKAN